MESVDQAVVVALKTAKKTVKTNLVDLAKKDSVLKTFLQIIRTHDLNKEAAELISKKLKV